MMRRLVLILLASAFGGTLALADGVPTPASLRALDPPAGPGAMAANLAVAGDDVLLTWLEPADQGKTGREAPHSLRLSRLHGGAWSTPVTIAAERRFFVNWADFPSIGRAGDGSLLAHWLEKSGPGTYAYDVKLARSSDGGATWTPFGRLNDDATESEHGFVSFVPEGNGTRAFWLDGRATAAPKKAQAGSDHSAEHASEGAMTLRTALLGETIGVSDLLDDRVCDCCQTSAAATSEGPIVVYRDRSATEVRDMSIVRRTGSSWSAPRTVHADGWEVPGCPVNGPSVAAEGRRVAVVWHTVPEGKARVLAAFSGDAGATFGDPVEVDGAGPLGRVGIVMDAGGDAIVSWLASEGDRAAVRVRRVTKDRAMGAPLTIASTARARSSGFPRIARAGDVLVVAWVDTAEPSRLRAALLPPAAVPRP